MVGVGFWLAVLLASPVIWGARATGVFRDMGLPRDDLVVPGDILLGGIVPLTRQTQGQVCGSEISAIAVVGAQAMIYRINEINRDPTLLPNVSLGLALLNDCGREMVSLVKATQFVPVTKCWINNSCPCTSDGHMGHGGCHVGTNGTLSTPPEVATGSGTTGQIWESRQYDVFGVVGPYSSKFSVLVSPFLSFYKLPHVSWIATSDDLSDRARYPYFSRVVPPDRFQADAIVDLLVHYNWTYISALYAQGSYGSAGIRRVLAGANDHGICVAYSVELRPDQGPNDYDIIVRNLRRNWRARVVVLFVTGTLGRRFMQAVGRAEAVGEFIFLTSEGFGINAWHGIRHLAVNIFGLIIPGGPFRHQRWGHLGFENYYHQLNPWNNATGNPWYGQYTPEDVGCSWNPEDNTTTLCSKYQNVTDFPGFGITNWPMRIIDAVDILVRAAHQMIKDKCPKVFQKIGNAKACVHPETLQEYIRKVKFLGHSTYVEFDDEGDLSSGRYMVMLQTNVPGKGHIFKDVGMWDNAGRHLELEEESIQVYVKTTTGLVEAVDMPESVCSRPCVAGEFRIQGELACCWECHPCRDEEKIRQDGRGCETCPPNLWPDQMNFTSCLPIAPTFINWTDTIAIALLAGTGVATLFAGVITWVFVKERKRKVIKGASRELTVPIIAALFAAYSTVLFFIKSPATWSCYVIFFGFHLSSAVVYSPLLVKTVRLYRIFRAAEKCEKRVRFADTKSVMAFLFLLVLVQLSMTVTVVILFPLEAALTMPVRNLKFVEFSCTFSSPALLAPLSYNLFLILLCALFGFLTRKLPDNFNESWYIFISVTTTLIVWIAFLPTYFIAFYAFHKVALLALALILNGTVTSVCLFGPKIYAVYFVDERLIKTTNFDGSTIGGSPTRTTTVTETTMH